MNYVNAMDHKEWHLVHHAQIQSTLKILDQAARPAKEIEQVIRDESHWLFHLFPDFYKSLLISFST